MKANPDAAEAALTTFQDFATHSRRLEQADHVANPFRPALDTPLPVLPGYLEVGTTSAALTAARGDPATALADLCRFASTWRRLRSHTDMLIVDMIGVSIVSSAAQLAGDIVADAPADLAWPASCQSAFAPLADAELDQCAELRQEARVGLGVIDELDRNALTLVGLKTDSIGGNVALLLLNREHARHKIAALYAHSCAAAAAQARKDRLPTPPPAATDVECDAVENAFDPSGCQLFFLAWPDFAQYNQRVLDLDGRIALLRTALWLRDQDGDAVQQVAQRPPELSTRHAVTVDTAARTLTVATPDQGGAADRKSWSVPYRLKGK